MNDAWQDQVSGLSDWVIPGYARQSAFYIEQAAEFRRKDQKVVVIVSDALRFEVAEECLRRIRALNRFDAESETDDQLASQLYTAGDGSAAAKQRAVVCN